MPAERERKERAQDAVQKFLIDQSIIKRKEEVIQMKARIAVIVAAVAAVVAVVVGVIVKMQRDIW